MDSPRGELDEEQDGEGPQEHGLDGEEVARHHSPALCSQELAPGRTSPTWRRPEAASPKDPPDRARAHADSELPKLALNPHAPPSRVLSAETDDEIGRLGIERRPTGCALTVGPLAPDELAVPAKERLGRDYERGPTLPAQRAARGGKERTIPVAKLRPVDRASEHLHLVTKDGVLELELCDDPTPGEQPDEAHEHEVREGSQGARDATCQRQSERKRVLEPHRERERPMQLWQMDVMGGVEVLAGPSQRGFCLEPRRV